MVKKNKEIKMKLKQKKVKQMTKEKTPKVVPTPPKKNKPVWKPKEEAPKSTTKNKQDGVEAEKRAALHIYLSEIGRSIKQEMNGEEFYSLDFKR